MFIEKIREKILIISIVIWNYIYIALILFLIGMMLGTLLSKEWVRGDGWYGGILRINSGPYSGDHYSSVGCCIYDKLAKAGIVFIVFELLSIILLLVWLTWMVYLTKGVDFLVNWAKILVLTGVILFHSVAIITWGGITGLGFNGNEHSSTGPALAVSTSVILPVFVGLYLIIFRKESDNVPNMDSIRIEARFKWSNSKSIDKEAENRN